MVASMSESVSTSRSSFREELWPLILAVHDESLGGDPLDFSLARKMGLGVEEHLSLHGIAKSSRQGKAVIKKFEELDDENEIPELVIEDNVTNPSSDEPETKGKQFTLDSF